MEKKKDNTVVKINTERNFADEVYKKYRSERYGIGTCCSSNLPSYIKDKYLCDYQDAKITQYDSITRTKTTYTPPIGGAEDDVNRPGWVDELCGNAKEEVEIYFYYDATSLGVSEVQAAYFAAHAWVNLIRAEAVVLIENDVACRTAKKQNIKEYHTVVFGERWLDWGTSAITGTFNNNGTGSCAGGNSGFPPVVNTSSKFWGILKWAQTNNIEFYSGIGTGGETVASTATTNNSGSTFASVISIGSAPAATLKNILGVTFIDEASNSGNATGPYHSPKTTGNTFPVTWAEATSNIGTANDGSDAVLQNCWKGDHTQFIQTRNNYLSQGADYKANFFCYPSAPTSANVSQKAFPLHAVGAISSGNKTIKDGTWTVAPINSLVSLKRLEDGNPYWAQGYGALDQQGWGVEPAELTFSAASLKADLNNFVDLDSCNDSECFFAVIKDANGNVVENHPIVFDGGIVAYTDELGLARWCVENASVDTAHNIDLCYCVTSTGKCTSSKFAITLTDDCLTACPATPFQACAPDDDDVSSGNTRTGCIDATADNYDPNATVDDGSCIYCSSLSLNFTVLDATETGGNCNEDGKIDTLTTGGTAPYHYQWLKNNTAISATTAELTGLCGGNYIVLITDAAGCTISGSIFVDQPSSLIYGCTDTKACNYDATATTDDGSCLYSGCTDSGAPDYDPTVTADCNCEQIGTANYQMLVNWDSCCTPCVNGCIDPNANNYNSTATCDDGSCDYNWSCEQTGGGASSICSGLLNVQINADDFGAYDFISDPSNLGLNTVFNTLKYSNTSLAPQGTDCVDIFGNLQRQLQTITFHLMDETSTIVETDPVNCDGNSWPPGWTTFQPTSSGLSSAQFTTIQSLITALNSTIADGQIYHDSNGTIVTTFSGLTIAFIALILKSSQGTGTADPSNYNDIFDVCSTVFATLTYQATNCDCTSGPAPVCTCTQMFDGSGIYPDDLACQSGINCCNPPATNYACVPGNVTNDCIGKDPGNSTIVYAATPTVNGGINQTLAQAWTHLFPTNTNPDQYFWWIDGYVSSCYDATLNASKVVLDEIILYKNSLPIINISAANTTSWSTLKTNIALAAYDGITYPDIHLMDYIQLRNTLDASEPGVWHLQGNITSCNCTPDPNCNCILDANGTYLDSTSCMYDCCPTYQAGCLDPDAINYYALATVENNTCVYCLTTFVNNNSAADVTISTVDPSTPISSDGCLNLVPALAANAGMATVNAGYTLTFSYFVFDVNNNQVMTGTSTNATSYGSCTYPEGLYTVYTYYHRSDGVNPFYGIICSNEYTVQIGNPNGSQLWECNPGSTVDSTSSLTFVSSLFSSINPVYTDPIQAVNTVTIYSQNTSIQDFWFYLDVNSSYWSSVPYVPVSTDCFNGTTGSVKMVIESIGVYDGGTLMHAIYNSSWSSLSTWIGGIISPSPAPNSYVDAIAALADHNANYTIKSTFTRAVCTTTGCGCVPSATGTFADEISCSTTCCLSGCTDPTADNYEPLATIDDGSCIYCGAISSATTILNPISPPAAPNTSWDATNINVNNGQIALVGIGGSGNYTTEVYFDGYNNDEQVLNNMALWPGLYQAKLIDDNTGCFVWVRDIQLGVLNVKCRDVVGAYNVPIGVWSETLKKNLINYKWNGSTATDDTIFNAVAANDGFKVNNLVSQAQSIKIYTAAGALLQSCVNCTSLSSGTQIAGDYYVEISVSYTTCPLIGFLFTYNGLANP